MHLSPPLEAKTSVVERIDTLQEKKIVKSRPYFYERLGFSPYALTAHSAC